MRRWRHWQQNQVGTQIPVEDFVLFVPMSEMVALDLEVYTKGLPPQ